MDIQWKVVKGFQDKAKLSTRMLGAFSGDGSPELCMFWLLVVFCMKIPHASGSQAN